MLQGYWIFHGFVSIKISFSKIYSKRRQLHISLRYPKLSGDSVIEESTYGIVCVYHCIYMCQSSPLMETGHGLPLTMSFWLSSVSTSSQKRETLIWLIWFPGWLSPRSRWPSIDEAPSFKMLMLPHCDTPVCVHMHMHMCGPYFFSLTCSEEVWWWVHHLNLPSTLRHSSKIVQNT